MILWAAEESGPGFGDERPRILIAEDNLVNQKVAVHLLQKAGYQCDVVGNGQEAVAAVRQTPYAAILMDCQMPEMDGYEATRAIRALGLAVPILAASAGATVEERSRCRDCGMDGFVAKPFRAEQLYQVLQARLQGAETALWPRGIVSAERLSTARLDQVAGGDPLFLREISEAFCIELRDCLGPIEETERPRLQKLAHVLKSSAHYVGAVRLSRMAEAIEKEARGAAWARLESLWASLQEEADALTKAMGNVIGEQKVLDLTLHQGRQIDPQQPAAPGSAA